MIEEVDARETEVVGRPGESRVFGESLGEEKRPSEAQASSRLVESPGAVCSLDDDRGVRECSHQAIALGEVARPHRGPHGEGGEDEVVGGEEALEVSVAGWVGPVEPRADDRQGVAVAGERCPVSGSVDALGQPGDDDDAPPAEGPGQESSETQGRERGLAGADDGDAGTAHQRGVAGSVEDQGGRDPGAPGNGPVRGKETGENQPGNGCRRSVGSQRRPPFWGSGK